MSRGPVISSSTDLARVRKSRRHPRPTQPDYLHLIALNRGLAEHMRRVADVTDVLDVWCGSRAYDDLFPPDATITGLDVVGNPYDVADVVTDEFLPFSDSSFDLVTCIQAFQFVPDPVRAVSEFERVLRPGGTALVSLVFGFEYDRQNSFEARYTEFELRRLFSGWEDIRVSTEGGRTATWANLTNSLAFGLEQRLGIVGRALHPLFAAGYASVSLIGGALDKVQPHTGAAAFPMNITIAARRA